MSRLKNQEKGMALLLVLVLSTVCFALIGAAYFSVTSVGALNTKHHTQARLKEAGGAALAQLEQKIQNGTLDISNPATWVEQYRGWDSAGAPVQDAAFSNAFLTPNALVGDFDQKVAVQSKSTYLLYYVVVTDRKTGSSYANNGSVDLAALQPWTFGRAFAEVMGLLIGTAHAGMTATPTSGTSPATPSTPGDGESDEGPTTPPEEPYSTAIPMEPKEPETDPPADVPHGAATVRALRPNSERNSSK